jgi:hypothetical protein
MEDFNSGQFQTIDEVVQSILSREGDVTGNYRWRYLEVAKEVFSELNLSAIKQTKRVLFTLDRRLNGIVLPDNYYKFSTISVINRDGRIEPLVFNSEINDDIVDQGLDKDCECECTDALCNYQRQYEGIEEQVEAIMPDDSRQYFTKTIRKRIAKDGSVFVQVNEPTAVYTDRVHTSTVLETTETLLCRLDIKECGCVKDNPHNRSLWDKHASNMVLHPEIDMVCEWGCPSPRYYPRSQTYNISNDGRRIIFPSNFPFDKVLLRYYAFEKTKDILVPRMAKKALMAGIKFEVADYDKKETQGNINKWKKRYTDAIRALRDKMSACMLNEFYEYYFARNSTQSIYFDHNRDHFNKSYQ